MMKDIAAECGISPSLLHHYFAKKEDLLVAIVYHVVFDVGVFAAEHETWASDYPDAHVRECIDVGVYYRLLYSLLLDGNPALFRLYTSVLFDAKLLNKGVSITIDHPLSGERLSHVDIVSLYMLNGCLSQVMALYYRDGVLLVPTQAAVSTALDAFYRMEHLDERQIEQAAEEVERRITPEMKADLWEHFENGPSDFFSIE